MHRLYVKGVNLPTLYIAKQKEYQEAEASGLPYVIWEETDELLVKIILLPTLQKRFPKINWHKVFGTKGIKQPVVHVPGGTYEAHGHNEYGGVADIADDVRTFHGGADRGYNSMMLGEYAGDMSHVNIEKLDELGLLPAFMSTIMNNISRNLFGNQWTEGYNKKLGVPVGNCNHSPEMNNLIILDVSGSIPRGIADTMIVLIDTLRHKTNADLIITSTRSKLYRIDDKLPNPNDIRKIFGLCNESKDFEDIINNELNGSEYANVISFGDNDAPEYKNIPDPNCKVMNVWHYHTYMSRTPTGYARWCNPMFETHYDRSWCECIFND